MASAPIYHRTEALIDNNQQQKHQIGTESSAYNLGYGSDRFMNLKSS